MFWFEECIMRSNYEVKLCARKSRDEVIWYTMNCSLQETMVWIHKMLFLAIKHLISNYSSRVRLILWYSKSILLYQWEKISVNSIEISSWWKITDQRNNVNEFYIFFKLQAFSENDPILHDLVKRNCTFYVLRIDWETVYTTSIYNLCLCLKKETNLRGAYF